MSRRNRFSVTGVALILLVTLVRHVTPFHLAPPATLLSSPSPLAALGRWHSHDDGARHQPPSPIMRSAVSTQPIKMTESGEEQDTATKEEEPVMLKVAVARDVDIPIQVAYDAFRDLPRHPSWARWLSSVEYITEDGSTTAAVSDETIWKMRYLGVTISWNAVSTRLEPPHVVEWKSTRGLRNYGLVEFEPLSETDTRMTLTMALWPPPWTVRFLKGRAARVVEERLLNVMLRNFRNVVVEEDLGRGLEKDEKVEEIVLEEVEKPATSK